MNNLTAQPYIQARRGFTLLELLIVVSVIAVLAGLSVTVMLNIDEQAREAATVTTLRKVDGLLQSRIQSFERLYSRGGNFKERYVEATRSLLLQKRIFGVREEVIELLAKKVAFRHNFPQRHEDMMVLDFVGDGGAGNEITAFVDANSDGVIGLEELAPVSNRPIDGSLINRISVRVERTAVDPSLLPDGDTWVRDETVSSELLYWALVHGPNFGSAPSIQDQFSADEISDTDGDGLLEFIDGWEQPLRFYRWPTALIDPVFTNMVLGNQQPNIDNQDDPTDVLLTTTSGVVGSRGITANQRQVANLLFKGLPPSSFTLPNDVLPRDLLLIDPDDSVGQIYAEMERLDGVNGVPQLLREFNTVWYHTQETYHSPLIVSAGSDGNLGLFEPSDSLNLGHLGMYDLSVNFETRIDQLSDNLTNRNRRAGSLR